MNVAAQTGTTSITRRLIAKLLRLNEDPDTSFSLISRLLSDQGARHWRGYVLAFVCMAFMAIATSLSAWIMKDVIDKVFIAKDVAALWQIATALVVISLVKGAATYGQQVTLARVANAIVADIQKRIFAKMMQLTISYYAARHSTDFIARQSFIGQSSSSALNMIITALSRDSFTLVGLVAVMIIQDPLMSVIALIFMPVAILAVRKLSHRARKVVTTEFSGFTKIMESMQEAVQGIRIVKAFTAEQRLTGQQTAAIAILESAANKLAMVTARSSPLMETLGGLAIALVVLYGGWRVIASGQAPGTFFSFITAVLMAYEPAKRLARVHVDLNNALVGVKMLYEFLDGEDVESDDENAAPIQVTSGKVELRDLHFSYRADEPVLRGMSFTAEAGKTTALVGQSGGGKSTVMSMLLRFWEPTAGDILIDGQSIKQVTRASLRQHISYVSQDTFLFNGTIRDNISVGKPDASEAEIIAAAKSAFAHDFISGFEHGYDTHVGEHGGQLSGGQRQRIAIARAFLKNAPILLLDEATSALDAESERAIQEALVRLQQGRTTLVIAHRLSTIQGADKICLISGGRVEEAGSHDELMQQRGGYFSLYSGNQDHAGEPVVS